MSCTLNFTVFLTNLLDLYLQVLVLIDAASTDDSVGCVGDMEGGEGNVRVVHMAESKMGLMS